MVQDDQVIELNLGYQPEAAVSGAVLVQSDQSTFLTFNAVSKGHDGLYQDIGIACLEFIRCAVTRFGYPNDEALPGHPLYSTGLYNLGYSICEVLNSSWISQIKQQNRVAFPDAKYDRALRHFIITFHDSTFECIADGFTSEVLPRPYEQIFARISNRILAE